MLYISQDRYISKSCSLYKFWKTSELTNMSVTEELCELHIIIFPKICRKELQVLHYQVRTFIVPANHQWHDHESQVVLCYEHGLLLWVQNNWGGDKKLEQYASTALDSVHKRMQQRDKTQLSKTDGTESTPFRIFPEHSIHNLPQSACR